MPKRSVPGWLREATTTTPIVENRKPGYGDERSSRTDAITHEHLLSSRQIPRALSADGGWIPVVARPNQRSLRSGECSIERVREPFGQRGALVPMLLSLSAERHRRARMHIELNPRYFFFLLFFLFFFPSFSSPPPASVFSFVGSGTRQCRQSQSL